MKNTNWQHWMLHDIRPLAAIASLLISLWMYIDLYPINYDGILYINAAEAYLADGLKSAIAIYRWPFYYVTFATISQWLPLSLEQSAYLLNALLMMTITVTFLTIIKELGGQKTVLIFAALIILLHPDLVKWRYYVVRDFGFWAFLLLSLLAFMRFYENKTWRYAIYWGLCITLATLFRIDGAAFLIFIPLIVLFKPSCSFVTRLLLLVKAYSFNVITLLIPIVALVATGKFLFSDFSRLHEFFNIFMRIINLPLWLDYLHTLSIAYSQTVYEDLGYHLIFNEWISFSVFIITSAILVIIKVAEVIQSLLAIYAWRYRLIPAKREQMIVLVSFLFVSLSIVLLVTLHHRVLAFRWVMASVIFMLIWSSFGLTKLYDNWKTQATGMTGKRWVFPIVAILMLAIAVGGPVRFGPSKEYLREAAHWLKANTSPDAYIISNEIVVAHYAERASNYDATKNSTANRPLDEVLNETVYEQHYDYLILSHRHNRDDRREEFIKRFGQPIAVFSNRHQDEVMIFKPPTANSSNE